MNMSAVSLKCDKCGKTMLKERHWEIQTNYVSGSGVIFHDCNFTDIDTVATFYLCKDCWKKFKEFVGVQ